MPLQKIMLGSEYAMPQAINVVVGDWARDIYAKEVSSRLQGVDVYQDKVIPLPYLYNTDFWFPLEEENDISIIGLDPVHWHYSDEIFEEYVRKIASYPFPVIRLFDSPYYERPMNISLINFNNMLYRRTKLAANIIKGKQPDTIILSPAICLVDNELHSYYRDYFMHNRMYFDAYAMHYCHDMKEHTLARLLTLLSEVLYILHKPVWVTRWAVPSCDFNVTNSEWKPVGVWDHVKKMKKHYQSFNEVANQMFWFFGGMVKDMYDPSVKIQSVDTSFLTSFCLGHEQPSMWKEYHFMGISDCAGHIKMPILTMLEELISEQDR